MPHRSDLSIAIDETPEALSEAARALGRIRTPKKAAAARENGKKGGRPRKKPLPPG